MVSDMHRVVLDLMTDFAVEALASGDRDRIGGLVRALAQRWPNEKALCISFALTSAAAHIEDLMQARAADQAPARAYKLAALAAADILAVEALGRAPARGHDLLHFWRRVDPYFLNL
jgi:hypothetical protein